MAGSRVAIRVKVEGADALLKRLDRLKRTARNKVLRPAVNEACNPVLAAARATAPADEGWLRKALAKRVKTYARSGVVVGVVGPRTGYQTTGRGQSKRRGLTAFGRKLRSKTRRRPSKYAHLVEYGTAPHRIAVPRGGGLVVRHPGSPATRFLRRAWEQSGGRAFALLRARVAAGLLKEARA